MFGLSSERLTDEIAVRLTRALLVGRHRIDLAIVSMLYIDEVLTYDIVVENRIPLTH